MFLVGVSRLESLGEPAGGVSLEGLKLWTLGARGVLGGDLDCLLLRGDLEREEEGLDGGVEVSALKAETAELLLDGGAKRVTTAL